MRVFSINNSINNTFYKNSFFKSAIYNNTQVPCEKVLDFLSLNSNYRISFSGPKIPIYAIDEEGNYTKFSSRREAADTIQTDASSISMCLNGKRLRAGGHYFVFASEIEKIDKNGNVTVDTELLDKKILDIKNLSKADSCKKPVYAIDKDANLQRFESVREAASVLGGSDSNISKCLKGEQHLCAGYGYVYADEIERKDDSGKIRLDKRKITAKVKEINKAIEAQPVIRPFYAVDKNGNYIKFERNRDAVHELGVNHSTVKDCLDGKRDTTGGYAFFYADEVEQIDENGNVVVNFDISEEIFDQKTPIPIYSIDKNGKIRRFDSKGAAATKLSVYSRNINACLSHDRETLNGYAFFFADDVEQFDDNGKLKLDYSKFERGFQKVIRNAVYIVDKNGKFRRYVSSVDASEALSVTPSAVQLCANGYVGSVKGHTVVKASYIEKFENGRVYYNLDLLKKFGEQAAKLQERPIVAFDSFGHSKRFNSKAAASKALGIRSDKILRCLNGEQKTSGGYRFEYVDETYSKKRDKTIFAINGAGDVTEFKNIDDAAKMLDIDKNDILHFLKKVVQRIKVHH